MKTLTLLRHAKSSWDDPSPRDFDRPLNARGRKAARGDGRELRRLGLAFDRIVASPAARGRPRRWSGSARPMAPLPLDLRRARLSRLGRRPCSTSSEAADDAHDRLLIVGHNPGLEQLALAAGAGGRPPRPRSAAKYPTGALAEIRFDVARWADVGEGAGTLARFIRPRDLAPGD